MGYHVNYREPATPINAIMYVRLKSLTLAHPTRYLDLEKSKFTIVTIPIIAIALLAALTLPVTGGAF